GVAMTKPRQGRLEHCEDERQPTQQRVQEEDHGDIDRRPWRVEEGEDAVPRDELPQRDEVGKCPAGADRRLAQRGLETRIEYPGAQLLVEAQPGANEDSG